MLDILFINPPWHRESGNIWKTVGSCQPPFGLALLAALARENGYSVDILDCNALKIGLGDVKKYLPKECPRFVGITATTVLIVNALQVAKLIKEIFVQTKLVIGGVHATVLPEEVLSSEYVDFIVCGEGEYAMLDLLSGKNLYDIKGLGFKSNNGIVLNERATVIPDINIFPRLLYEVLPMDKYYPAAGSFLRKPALGMITSRGCPGRCTFCKGDVLGALIRFRSADKIVEEIIFLQKIYNIKEVQFYDDTFTANKPNVKRFCQLIIDNKIDITWCCFSRVDTVDEETLHLMKKAGCHQIMFGVESADQMILNNINKKITFGKVEETIEITKRAGIEVRLAFMFGNPGETEESMEKNIKYAIKLNPDLVSFNITTPYPGTAMFEWAKQNNYLIHTNWSEYNLSKPVMRLPTVAVDKVLEYYKKGHRRFYLRWSYLLLRLKRMKNFQYFWRDVKSFCGMLKFFIIP